MRAAPPLIAFTVLLAACSGSGPSASTPPIIGSGVPTPPSLPTPVPTAVVVPSTATPTATGAPIDTPTATRSPAETIAPRPTGVPGSTSTASCPTASPLRVIDFVEADQSCFGSRDASLVAWLGALPPMGWEGPYIEPAWLAYPPNIELAALWQVGPGGEAMCGGDPSCSLLIVHLRPETSIVLGAEARWVLATGHRADPAAASCHYVFDESWPGATPPNSQAQEECRSQFVLTALRDAAAPAEP